MPITNAFVHIPRTGGTTVHDCLGKYATNRPDHEFLGKDARIKYHGYFLYTFMRNPYTRMISCYESQFPRELGHYHLPNEDEHLTFERYVDIIVEWGDDNRKGHLQHWRPQTDWIFDNDNHLALDYIGHTETLEKDAHEISNLIGVEEEVVIPRRRGAFANVSTWRHEDYKEYFNDDTRKKVEKYYERDLEFLKVKF